MKKHTIRLQQFMVMHDQSWCNEEEFMNHELLEKSLKNRQSFPARLLTKRTCRETCSSFPEDLHTCIKLTWESLGQMSDSPQNGLTVMVLSSSTGRLSLKPPSIYRTPRNEIGSHPLNPGMNAEHKMAYRQDQLVLRSILSGVYVVRISAET